MGINIIYLLTSLDGIFDTTPTPGFKKSAEGDKDISPVQYKKVFFKFEKCARDYVCIPDYLRAHLYTSENDF